MSAGVSPGRLALQAAAAQQGGLRLRRAVPRDGGRLPGRAALGRPRGPDHAVGQPHHRPDHGRRQEEGRGGARRRADRPDLARDSSSWAPTRNGRDIMVRLLYGGRNSLMIGVLGGACSPWSSVGGAWASWPATSGGWTDSVIARVLDIIWAFPVVLLGVALGTALALGGLKLGPIKVAGRLALDPDPDHRRGLHPVHGPADPRAGARPARAGVRRGGAGAGGGAAADHVLARSCPTWPRRSSSSSR